MFDIKRFLADYNASKWPEYKASLATDVVYEEIATRVHVKSADEYMKVVQRWKRAFPDLKATLLDSSIAGDKIVVEVQWEGTQTGPLDGPFGAIPPTNKAGALKAALVITVKNDKVVEAHHYFDMLTMLTNLGITPFAGAPAPATKPGAAPTHRH